MRGKLISICHDRGASHRDITSTHGSLTAARMHVPVRWYHPRIHLGQVPQRSWARCSRWTSPDRQESSQDDTYRTVGDYSHPTSSTEARSSLNAVRLQQRCATEAIKFAPCHAEEKVIDLRLNGQPRHIHLFSSPNHFQRAGV
jgi:hypothetical protein